MLRNNFTDNEWQILKNTIKWIFRAVAEADGNIDLNEHQAIEFTFNLVKSFKSELARELILDLKNDRSNLPESQDNSFSEAKDDFKHASEILQVKLDAADALYFKKTILAIGLFIANSSGTLLSYRISNEEQQVIKLFALYFKLTNAEYYESPSPLDIMGDFRVQ
ncbi:MAG: hypothetical protein NT007_03900 [Candidatus Kapabacteria bacterium]|nr:hypothetical protein [Candidatus Kapabacteria bacterium]